MNAEFAAIARKLIEIAGLSDIVTVVVGPADDSLRKLVKDGRLKSTDLLFLDHVEELYVTDFKVCEELGLLKEGAVIVADNVVRPGAPEYRELVRNHSGLKSEGVRGLIQPGDMEVGKVLFLVMNDDADTAKDELEISYVKAPSLSG
jgi:catechol O-methyltransferase